jgi:chemotaxis protein CheX
MEPTRDDLLSLVDQTWQTLFGDAIEPNEPAPIDPAGIRATVSIRGAWQGRVVLDFTAGAAEAVACGLLEAKPGELETAAILDAAGEMANILAGNLKSMVPQPSTLGLPVTYQGARLLENPDFSNENHHLVSFLWKDTQISVTFVEGSDGDGA